MLVAMNSPTDYKQVMEICVCNLENPDCMLQHYDSCPDSSVLKEFFVKELLNTCECDDSFNGLAMTGANLWSKRAHLMILLMI